jgi:hypothetical protein
MKDIKDITQDILQSLNQKDNPVGILLEGYLQKVITDIVRDKIIDFQSFLYDEDLITGHDWGYEDKANEFLSGNEID